MKLALVAFVATLAASSTAFAFGAHVPVDHPQESPAVDSLPQRPLGETLTCPGCAAGETVAPQPTETPEPAPTPQNNNDD